MSTRTRSVKGGKGKDARTNSARTDEERGNAIKGMGSLGEKQTTAIPEVGQRGILSV